MALPTCTVSLSTPVPDRGLSVLEPSNLHQIAWYLLASGAVSTVERRGVNAAKPPTLRDPTQPVAGA